MDLYLSSMKGCGPVSYSLVHAITALALTILPFFGSKAQDLIVRLNGDSVNCKITGSDKEGIHYSFLYDGKMVNSYAPFSAIKHHEKDHYSEIFSGGIRKRDIRSHQIFRAAIMGCYGHYTGKLDDTSPQWVQDHDRRLRSASGVFGEVHLFVNSFIGVGIVGGLVNSGSTTGSVSFLMEDGSTRIGTVKDDISVKYYGPSVLFYQKVSEGWNVRTSLSGGVLDYRNKAIVIEPLTAISRTFGFRVSGALEYRSKIGAGMGLFVSMTRATLQNLSIEGDPFGYELLKYNKFIDLSRLDVGVVFSFTL